MTSRAVVFAARADSLAANLSLASALRSASSHAAVARSAMPWSLCISPSATSARSIAFTIFSVAPALDSRWNAMSALRVPVMARMSFSASMAAPASFRAFHSWSISSCTSSAWSFLSFSTLAAAVSAAAFAAAVSSLALASPAATAAFSASQPLGISASAAASFCSSASTRALRLSRSDSAASARRTHSSNLPGNGRSEMISSIRFADSALACSVSLIRSAHSVWSWASAAARRSTLSNALVAPATLDGNAAPAAASQVVVNMDHTPSRTSCLASGPTGAIAARTLSCDSTHFCEYL
mmetsp:Transcript_9100/g.37183  ORF Transcript_9100/g.37183 Transcript_9100/m.37183 type:complete len:297 (+) Transcript_9100:3652-4542(+)